MTTAAESVAKDFSPLFAPPIRWGWEFVQPAEAALSPERSNPPVARSPKYVSQPKAAGATKIALIATGAAIAIIWIDSSTGLFSPGGWTAPGSNEVLGVLGNLGAAAACFWVVRAWIRPRTATNPNTIWSWVVPGVAAVITFVAPYLILPLAAIAAWLRRASMGSGMVPDPGDMAKAQAEYDEAIAAWQQRVVQFEAAEQRRATTVDIWYPVHPTAAAQTICVFGGSQISWAAALTTLGASMLGDGTRLLLLDLSRWRSSEVLQQVALRKGISMARNVLPADSGVCGLLAGFTWADLTTVVVELLYSTETDAHASRQGRQDDRAIIREVAGCLDPSKPVSFVRLRRAMVAAMGGQVEDRDDISESEYDQLSRLYNQVQRERGGVLERLTRIERSLRDFDAFKPEAGGSSSSLLVPMTNGAMSIPQLQVVDTDKGLDDLDYAHMVDLVFQLLILRLRSQPIAADALIVLGADQIRRTALESMTQRATINRLRVLLFFEHLREDAVALIGTGSAAAAFFALGNHKEAKEATEFIGAGYKWVESQHTRSQGESLNRTFGVESGGSESQTTSQPMGGSFSQSVSTGSSYSSSFGKSKEYSSSDTRVREALVDPEVIQGLPVTGMIWVEVMGGGQRIAANVDCNPEITFAPRVALHPRALPSPS